MEKQESRDVEKGEHRVTKAEGLVFPQNTFVRQYFLSLYSLLSHHCMSPPSGQKGALKEEEIFSFLTSKFINFS